jgi:hypothetical protein
MEYQKLRIPAIFLAKFALVSALLLVFWLPISRSYLSLVIVPLNLAFQLIDHPAGYALAGDRLYVRYPPAAAAPLPELTFQVVRDIHIHFNILLLLALVAATPAMPLARRASTLGWGMIFLLIYHGVYLYLFSYMAIWDWVESGSGGTGLSQGELWDVARTLDSILPHRVKLYLEDVYLYLNHFGREGVPLLVWLVWTFSRN